MAYKTESKPSYIAQNLTGKSVYAQPRNSENRILLTINKLLQWGQCHGTVIKDRKFPGPVPPEPAIISTAFNFFLTHSPLK